MSGAKDRVRLCHMLESAREAVELMQGKGRPDLDSDRLLGLALARLLKMIGDAANRVSTEYRSAHAAVPWSGIDDLRDHLIEEYYAVDLDLLWKVFNQDLPDLVGELETIILREGGT